MIDVEERGRVLNIRPRTPIDQNVITPISEEGKNINAIEIPVSIPPANLGERDTNLRHPSACWESKRHTKYCSRYISKKDLCSSALRAVHFQVCHHCSQFVPRALIPCAEVRQEQLSWLSVATIWPTSDSKPTTPKIRMRAR